MHQETVDQPLTPQQQEDFKSQKQRLENAARQLVQNSQRVIDQLSISGDETKDKQERMNVAKLEVCAIMHDVLPGDLYSLFGTMANKILDLAIERSQSEREAEKRRLREQIETHLTQINALTRSIIICESTLESEQQ